MPSFEARDDAERVKLGDALRRLYGEMRRNMPLDRRMEINRQMEEASKEASQAGISEEVIKKIREEARKKAVRDQYEEDIERERMERRERPLDF